MQNLTLINNNGVSLQIHSITSNLGYIINQKPAGFEMPEIALTSYNKVGEFGAIVSNQLYGGRPMTIPGQIFADDMATYQTRRRALENVLGIIKDNYSTPQPILMKFTTDDSLALQSYVFLQKLQMLPEFLTSGKFVLDLYSPDFAFESQTLQTLTISPLYGGGAVFPAVYPLVYGAESGGTGTATNNGNAKIWPTIYLNGPLTNPTIQNSTLGYYVKLSMTIASGQQVVITPKSRLVTLSGVSQLANKVSGSVWWWLNSGNNTIALFTDSNGDTGNAQIQWRDGYMGI